MESIAEKTYSVKEYFDLEAQSEVRREYVHGTLIEMPGESKIANKISLNCAFALRKMLQSKGFEIYTHDVRLMIGDGNIYRYPDVVVVPTTDREDSHIITSPVLIVEVLSENTEATDRGKKLQEYCSLSSLQYYLLVSQDATIIECYSRLNTGWQYTFYTQQEDKITLDFFQTTLSPAEVYEGIDISDDTLRK